jgi:hypothetical protein
VGVVIKGIAAGLLVVMVFGCSKSSESEIRASAVYEGVMRWLAAEHASDPDPLPVFVEPRGEGTSIDLEVQAEVVESVADVADVRFIDTRDEALESDDESGLIVVRDGGLLIRLGPVLEEGQRVTLDVDIFVDEEADRTIRFSLVASGDEWRVVGDPLEVIPG